MQSAEGRSAEGGGDDEGKPMSSIAVQVLLLLLGAACAGLGWSIVDAVVRRRSADAAPD